MNSAPPPSTHTDTLPASVHGQGYMGMEMIKLTSLASEQHKPDEQYS